MKRKVKSVTQLKREADKAWSLYVRIRDSDRYGMVKCITCPTKRHYKEIHAGHFQSRRYGATRYSDTNVNGQCPSCNTFNAGEQFKYAKEIDLKYGDGTAQALEKEARQIGFKFTRQDLLDIISEAKANIQEATR